MKYLKALIAAFKLQRLGAKIKGEFRIQSIIELDGLSFVVLPRNPSTEVPGVQSLFWESRQGHSLVEPYERTAHTVSFKILKNFRDKPKQGDSVWLSGWLGEDPADFGIQKLEKVSLDNSVIATVVRRSSKKWVIHVHGRNAAIGETLRNFSQFDKLGFNQLFLPHESDPKPEGLGKRKSDLGVSEWKQVEAAVREARNLGATEVVLFGWSLGAMIIGQFMIRSEESKIVSKLIMDSPLVDYRSTLRLQSELAGYKASFGDYVYITLTKSYALKTVGFGYKELPSLLHEYSVPVLVLYSKTDGYVSMEMIPELKSLNKTLVLREFENGKHCRLYNQNPEFYLSSIEDFIKQH